MVNPNEKKKKKNMIKSKQKTVEEIVFSYKEFTSKYLIFRKIL